MTTLVYAEVLRFVYAFSLLWRGLLTWVGLLALVGAVVLAAWQFRNLARKSIPRWVAASRQTDLVTNRRPRRAGA
jgi:hypothetical protein